MSRKWLSPDLEDTEAADELGDLIASYEKHIENFDDLKLEQPPVTLDELVNTWALQVQRKDVPWNATVNGYSLLDMLFVATCYHHVSRDPAACAHVLEQVLPKHVPSIQSLWNDVRSLGVAWKQRHVPRALVRELFDRCAATVVFAASQGMDAFADLCRHNYETQDKTTMARIVAESGGNEIRSAGGEGKQDALAMDAEKQRQKQRMDDLHADDERTREFEIHELASRFVPWCGRVFFPIWFDLSNLDPLFPPQQEEKQRELKTESRADAWLQDQVEYQPSDEFINRFREQCYRWNIPIGATLFAARSATAAGETDTYQTLFGRDMDRDTQTSMYSSLSGKLVEMAKDETGSGHRQTLAIFMFGYMFQQTLHTDWLKLYLVLSDETVSKAEWIRARKAREGRPRRPLLVCYSGAFYVHSIHPSNQSVTVTAHATAIRAICDWIQRTLDLFQGELEDGHSIRGQPWIVDMVR